ncbi:SIR2 family protein [Brevibacillus dissolubilis]|uniref:SIR2 family protein n=1 Tax=Brevibacillus dissolubilis TaxID=1844116 RepID=UPI001117372F|nr:SIR2 family protein [Brevibacillus dissolubilis]
MSKNEKTDLAKCIELDVAINQIYQACIDTGSGEKSPFFFLVGAGISVPSTPLAKDIINHCKEKARHLGRVDKTKEPDDKSTEDSYSDWFELAYPNRYQRQKYLKDLIIGKPISTANFKLAHLLSEKVVTNLVITPNFDDFLSRALNEFGISHVVSDHPHTVEKINTESEDIQIVHVHGTYWFYDCCNLKGEIVQRAEKKLQSNKTMSFFVESLLYRRSPIVVGYSGWENDVIMSSLKRRLESSLPYNVYWMCYKQSDINQLPGWLIEHPDVYFVIPALKSQLPNMIMQKDVLKDSKYNVLEAELQKQSDKVKNKEDKEIVLDARTVFEALIKKFNISSPEITRDPINFFVKKLIKAFDIKDSNEPEETKYFLKQAILRLEKAKESKDYNTNPLIEELREMVRQSKYKNAINEAKGIYHISLPIQDQKELIEVLLAACEELKEDYAGYDLVIDIINGLRLHLHEANDVTLYEFLAAALIGKGRILVYKKVYDEGIMLFDEVINQFSSSNIITIKVLVVEALLNKALTLDKNLKHTEEMLVYEVMINNYNKEEERAIVKNVAKAYYNKAMTLFDFQKTDESLEVLDKMIQTYIEVDQIEVKRQVAKAMLFKGSILNGNHLPEQAILIYETLIDRYQNEQDTKLEETVANALRNKGLSLHILSRHSEAIEIYENIFNKFGDSKVPSLQEQAAKALVYKATTMGEQGFHDEALQSLDEVINGYQEITAVSELALIEKGNGLNRAKRYEEAINYYDELLGKHEYTDSSNVLFDISLLYGKSIALQGLEQFGDALQVYERIEVILPKMSKYTFRELINDINLHKATLLEITGYKKEAVEAYELFILENQHYEDQTTVQAVCNAYNSKGLVHISLGNHEVALETFNSFILYCKTNFTSYTEEMMLRAMVNKALLLFNEMAHYQSSIDVYMEISNNYSNTEQEHLKKYVTAAMHNQAIVLSADGRNEEMFEVIDNLVDKFNKENDVGIREIVASSLIKKAQVHFENDQMQGAVETLSFLDMLYKDSIEPTIKIIVAQGLMNKGIAHHKLGENTNALETYEDLLNRLINENSEDFVQCKAEALLTKGLILEEIGEKDAALAIFEKITIEFGNHFSSDIKIVNIKASFHKASLLLEMGCQTEGINEYRNLITNNKDEEDSNIKKIVASSLIELASHLSNRSYYQEAITLYEEIVSLCEKDASLTYFVSQAYNAIAYNFVNIGNKKLAKSPLLKSFKLGHSGAGINLCYLKRRNEIVDESDIPEYDILLRQGLEEGDPFAIVNKALLIISQNNDWKEANELIKRIKLSEDKEIVLNWWLKLVREDDPEGHLIIGLFDKHSIISDPDGIGFRKRFEFAGKETFNIPVWMLKEN